MTKTITVHSHKGGAGKTSTAVNLAAILVERGFRVVVIDLDLNAPSLQTYAPGRSEKKMNDLFLENADLDEIIFDATYLLNKKVPGKLFFGLSDISGDVISKMGQRSRDSLLNDLYVLMGITKNQLPNDPWNADYIFIDTPPGLSTSSINGVATADHLLLLLRLVNADINGTYHFLKTLHKVLRPRTSIVINQVPSIFVENGGLERSDLLIKRRIIDHIGKSSIDFLGIVEQDEDMINSELEYAFSEVDTPLENRPRPIHHITHPDGLFSRCLQEIADGLIEE